ncbi:LacI family DNA-binding transcriptional regulator [Hymenobacter chitinivorans]|uniref:LacI family transcriptional regulator n=1 Tax=Hymenobacter chitinivorans DSM 11115 TaxID=1121954 RepID=A0A2M9BL71_9BACT|nr:LacI family DNA-binding transcriptional regulator [Hymenobacter chitinivorans]PJJ58698.1 LacI family transcriptional regulator [Hymenobacter chitinivorans DSM 11115]
MKPINLKKLAQELNLSVATVSRALNDRYDISQGTKDRVRALANKLNYEPNPYASSLRRQKSKTIGVVIPEVANHFFSLAINGIEEVARHNNYHVLIYLTHEDYQRELAMARLLASGRVDGVLLSVASESADFAHLEFLRERGIPIVFFDRVYDEMPTAKVTTDDYESGYRATEHLLDAGCRTVAHLTVSQNLSISRRRKEGYIQALADRRIAYDESLVLVAQETKAQDIHQIQQLLTARPDVDGIFAAVESQATSSYEACRNLGRAIPEDIKIIGFSNLEIASLLQPALTTITQPAYSIGKEAAKILFQAISKNRVISPAQSLVLNSELVVRASTTRTP